MNTPTSVPAQEGKRVLDPQFELESNQTTIDTATQQVLLETDKQIYKPGNVIKLVIPTGRANTMLLTSDTYLYFTVSVKQAKAAADADFSATNTGGFNIDRSAECFFNRLEVIHNEIIETRTATNVHSCLQMDLREKTNKIMLTEGAPDDTDLGGGNSLMEHDEVRKFCIPLRSSVVGVDNPRALPLFMISGSDLVIRLTLEDAATAVAWRCIEDDTNAAQFNVPQRGNCSYEISEVYMGASIVQLSTDAASSLVSNYPNAVISTPFVGHSMASASAAESLQQINVVARYARAAKIEVIPRQIALLSNPAVFSLHVRPAPKSFKSINFECGGICIPTRRIQNKARCAYHTLMSERLHNCRCTDLEFDGTMYNASTKAWVATTTSSTSANKVINDYKDGRFFFAQNWDYNSQTFDTHSLIQGWDLRGVTTEFHTQLEYDYPIRYDFFITNIATLAVKDSILRSWN